MSATVRETKTLGALDLSIRTLKPRTALAASSECSEKQSARVVVVTTW